MSRNMSATYIIDFDVEDDEDPQEVARYIALDLLRAGLEPTNIVESEA